MRRALPSLLFVVAATCWVVAGPGGDTTAALLACRHHAAHHARGAHHAAPADGPCFCDQMTHGLDVAVSTAVPTTPDAELAMAPPVARRSPPTLFPLPPSPAFAPAPPPPNGLG